ncbi:hypothetical protein D9758_012741 [Tetrapyrgos nigripes]|uniref:Haloacid dehalogenase n=1 Tax=Tetrapyrgos nigripes TaxID=182062 RepID=A0A8H5CTN6_9AGAR|nr:hypothetical protein D9758_012741 [Tetrapyrgos nigripes]
MSNSNTNPLTGIEALVFDVFGTVVDWRNTVAREIKEVGRRVGVEVSEDDCYAFADEWRQGYIYNTRRIAEGGEGPKEVDVMHRQILDTMLSSSRWSQSGLGSSLDEGMKKDLNLIWHRLDGWPDSSQGLKSLKEHVIIVTLSNGNVRLLVDMAKHAKLPWDTIFSTALFDSYKPNPITYQSALSHLSLSSTPSKAAMVAAHIHDLRAAAKVGMKTIFVKRETEDSVEVRESVRAKSEGGEVDVVVDNLEELAGLFAARDGRV